MKGKRLVAYYDHMQTMYFGKDTVLIPLYLSKIMNLKGTYYFGNNIGREPLPKEYRGLELVELSKKEPTFWRQLFQMLRYIVLPARSIDMVFLIHTTHQVLLTTILYKLINPKGHVMVMGDIDDSWAQKIKKNGFLGERKGVKRKLMKKFIDSFFKRCDVFSVENKNALTVCTPIFEANKWNCLVHCYPGFDDTLFHNLNMKRLEWDKKENIILYVGRIGCYQKNTDMILDAASQIDLRDWKIILIGPFTDDFSTKTSSAYSEKVELFFKEHPQLQDKIIFTGAIFNQKEILEYLNRAKIFLLTSRHEGFCNSLSQAAALGCYIISTDVGGAQIVTNGWKFGQEIPQEDSVTLAKILRRIVNNEQTYPLNEQLKFDELTWSGILKTKVLPKLGYRNDKN